MGGFTVGRKLAALAELNHVQVAPHHDCYLHAHIVAGCPAGLIVESFTDPERDPLQAELFEDPPEIRDGMIAVAPPDISESLRLLRRFNTQPGSAQ